jgi:phage terminase large subunit-like protein
MRTENDLPVALDDPRFTRGSPQHLALVARQLDLMKQALAVTQGRKFYRLFPDEDTPEPGSESEFNYARFKYPKHMEFFLSGAHYRERGFIAGNRTGKTVAGGYETAVHLTGLYPHWWEGKRFTRPIRGFVSGKTSETTRDILQTKLLGSVEGSGPTKRLAGTGIIPAETIGAVTWKNFPNLADSIKIRHVSGGWSTLWLKSYEQGRGIFEGTELEWLWFDEEPPINVYEEGLIRTATTGGLIVLTFTPLEGWTTTVEQFLGNPDDL